MTITAHGTRHVYDGATRPDGGCSPAGNANFFAELNPHLRNVKAITPTNAEIIHGWLLRRGPKTADEIVTRLGRTSGHNRHQIDKMLRDNPHLFERRGRTWTAIPQPQVVAAPASNAPLRDQIRAWLASNGPATANVIAVALGKTAQSINSAMSRGHDGMMQVGMVQEGRKRKSRVWGVV